MTIRPMERADIPAVAEIEKACFSSPWSEESLASSLSSGHTAFFLAEEDGVAAGYIGTQLLPPEGDILNLAVRSEYRRRRIGRKLLDAALEHFRLNGVKAVVLEVRASNMAAQRLYASAGFQPVGIRRGFYAGPPEDAVLMRALLEPAL